MHQSNYLTDILIILSAAVVIIPIFKRLRLGTVPGYLVAGILVGPFGIGFIGKVSEIRQIAEFGVVFLLFIIGIELKPSRLWLMRHNVFGLGTAQVLLTGLFLCAIAYFFQLDISTAIIVGFGLSLSSTAFVLQILTEKNKLDTPHGNTSLSILLFQDLAVIPIILLVSFLAADSGLTQGSEFKILEGVLAVSLVILIGKFILNPILHLVAASRNTEVFMASALLLVLGISYLTEMYGLSMALGSFLAGLLLADSNYRHQIAADIQPFRGILLGLFFMSIGMSVNINLFQEKWPSIIALVIILLLLKIITLWALSAVFKVQKDARIQISFLLSQSGEFGFVIFALALKTGLIQDSLYQLLIMLIVLTMAATPVMSYLAEWLKNYLTQESKQPDIKTLEPEQGRVVVAGLGRVGTRVIKTLTMANIPYVALDNNPDQVTRGKNNGFNAFYGNALHSRVLKAVGIDNASTLVIAFREKKELEQLIKIMTTNYPQIPILARAHDREHSEELKKAGVSVTISEVLEAGLELGGAVLKSKGMSEEQMRSLLQDTRQEYYK